MMSTVLARRVLALRVLAVVLGVAILTGSAFAQVKVTGAKLNDLVGSGTLVTVVLKGNIKDSNLQVASINGATITFLTEKGEQAVYSVSGIEEIQVQGGAVEKPKLKLLPGVLAPGDKQVVERAYGRALEIFGSAQQEQNVKIQVAALLALNKNEEAQKYLQQLAAAGELQTGLEACKAMYLAGMPLPDGVLRQGLASGNRTVRGAAAELSGLTKYSEADAMLVRLAQDRAWEISAPACRAVARLGNREIIPTLLSQLDERNDDKADAIEWSLIRLGGKDIIEQLKLIFPQTQGIEKYRVAYLLYRLGDAEGRRRFLDVMTEMPTLALEAAIVLGADGDVTAMDALRQRLRRREDETEENLVNRARTAEALVKGGDPSPKGILQELMRSPKKRVRNEAFELTIRLNSRTMLALMQSSIENVENAVAAEAATCAVALASSDFRDRLLDLRATEEAAIGKKEK